MVAIAAALMCLGCGDSGPDVGIVSGTVTMNGDPLENALVEFDPLFQGGSTSYSITKTDASGYYEMGYQADRPGVLLGEHEVRISTYDIETLEDGSKRTIKENVPVRYNSETELKFTVEKGQQTANFDLVTK